MSSNHINGHVYGGDDGNVDPNKIPAPLPAKRPSKIHVSSNIPYGDSLFTILPPPLTLAEQMLRAKQAYERSSAKLDKLFADAQLECENFKRHSRRSFIYGTVFGMCAVGVVAGAIDIVVGML